MKPVALVTTLFLCLIAVGHVIRIVFSVSVTVTGIEVPLWASLLGALVTATLAFLLWRESRAGKPAQGQ